MADREATASDFMEMASRAAETEAGPTLAAAFTLCAVLIRCTDRLCDSIHDARPDSGV